MIRVGQGGDIHELVVGRKLIIGGVTIPNERGLLGHSDADVLVHAIIDALLGAAGLGDIGQHFPDSDERYRGADSRKLLRATREIISLAGWRIINVDSTINAQRPKIVNVDSTINAQRPKMAAHIPLMVAHIADDLQVPRACINIKAKTAEGLGPVGREEGISADAIALIEHNV